MPAESRCGPCSRDLAHAGRDVVRGPAEGCFCDHSGIDWCDLGIDWYDSGIDWYDSGIDRYDLRIDRYDLRIDRYDLRIDRYDLRIDRYDLRIVCGELDRPPNSRRCFEECEAR
jgi:hypothetical protein